jgi:hypothetical protein
MRGNVMFRDRLEAMNTAKFVESYMLIFAGGAGVRYNQISEHT